MAPRIKPTDADHCVRSVPTQPASLPSAQNGLAPGPVSTKNFWMAVRAPFAAGSAFSLRTNICTATVSPPGASGLRPRRMVRFTTLAKAGPTSGPPTSPECSPASKGEKTSLYHFS